MYKILKTIDSPADLKRLTHDDLLNLSAEIRKMLIESVTRTGGHLASSLGAVELTLALHRVFESPRDKIILDVGHQGYVHKLITGRRERFQTLRQFGGLSGFPERSESPHDAFGAGHAGNSISAALGMALARDLGEMDYHVAAVIGDGSIASGMALEAVNHAGHAGSRMTIVYNDNGMSISPSVGALNKFLNRIRFNPLYDNARGGLKERIESLPGGTGAWNFFKGMKDRIIAPLSPALFWEGIGFKYLGPVDGHDIGELEAAFKRARNHKGGPTLVHVITQKGKGYSPAEEDAVRYHGISPAGKKKDPAPTYSRIFAKSLCELMDKDPRVVAISAAMVDGTGLTRTAEKYPARVFDVGICEQHAVTLAAGLAAQGFIPVVAIYSTFLQRAYDQIVSDVCLQGLPVIFAIDRAGIVGEDGKTHHGAFDLSYLRGIPNMVIAAPGNEDDLTALLASAVESGRPYAIRYPRGRGPGITTEGPALRIETGKGETLREGEDATLCAIGSMANPALEAAEILAAEGIDCEVIDARFVKPLDEDRILTSVRKTGRLVTIEENTLNAGFGSAVIELLAGEEQNHLRIERIGLPDAFITHGEQNDLRARYGLDPEGIAARVRTLFQEGAYPLYTKTLEGIR